jgi:RNA polymerase sigma factor (sigma-70 family)
MATAPMNRILGHLRVSVGDGSDAELLQAFLTGRDSAAFAAIVRRHGPAVLSACRQVLRQESDVEDAFQATFLVLLKKGHAIRRKQSLGSWLFGVAHRVAVNARCRRAKLDGRERTNEELPHPPSESPDLSWREASKILHEELNRLPDKLRLPLLLCHLEGKSRDEAAAELGWTLGKLKGMLERGRSRLRARLQRRGIALSAGLLAAVETASSASIPSTWVDSIVSFEKTGIAPPGIAAIAKGVQLVFRPIHVFAAALGVAILVAAGVVIASSTSTDQTPPKKEPPSPVVQEPPKPAAEQLTVTGKVIDADRKPVAGAKLYIPALKRTPPTSEDDIGTKLVGETAADGSYKVTFEKSQFTRYLIVGAPGHGIAWENLQEASGSHEATVKLAKDQSVGGRIIDTEGKPVAGATVRVMSLLALDEGKLDKFLTGWKNDWQEAMQMLNNRMYMPLESVHGDGKSDADGRFALKGIGIERVAHVEVTKPGYGKATVYIVAQPGLDAAPINKAATDKIPPRLRIPGQPPLLAGPKAEVVVEGTKVIEGTVTDAETGKPLAGVMVTSGSGYNSHLMAASDKDGKYRLTGLIKNREYLVHTATRDKKTTYLSWSARIRDTEGLTPIRHDITMTRGIVVTGRLIDRKTGKPIDGSVRFAPLPDNKFFGTSPAYSGYSCERFSHSTEGGKFRVVTIPGTSLLTAQVHETGEKIGTMDINPFLSAVPDPDYSAYFAKDDDGSYRVTAAGNSLEFLANAQACKVVDLKPDAKEVEIDIYLERGKTATLKVVDDAGKPLEGAVVTGLTSGWAMPFTLPKDTATIYALNADNPRTLFLMHAGRKLGGTLAVKGDESEPVTAKLVPLGSISGKLIDTDGSPIVGVAVTLNFPSGGGNTLYRDANLSRAPVVTDKDGVFRLDNVVPGAKFYLNMTRKQEYFIGEPKIGLRQVEPGKTLDLGMLTVKGQKFGD